MSFAPVVTNFETPDPFWLAKKMRKTQFGDNKNRHKLSRQEIAAMMKKQEEEANASAAVSLEGEGTSGEVAAGGNSETGESHVAGNGPETPGNGSGRGSEQRSDIGSSATVREPVVVVS